MLQVEDDPLHRRLFQLFDDDDSGEISLREFIVGISSYTGAEPKDKLRFAFMMSAPGTASSREPERSAVRQTPPSVFRTGRNSAMV